MIGPLGGEKSNQARQRGLRKSCVNTAFSLPLQLAFLFNTYSFPPSSPEQASLSLEFDGLSGPERGCEG